MTYFSQKSSFFAFSPMLDLDDDINHLPSQNYPMALLLHSLIAQESGGSTGIRDLGLLDSALQSAFQTFDGKDLYPTKTEKAARLGYSLISNHAFVDGNKRIGVHVMLAFLEFNGIHMKFSDEELVEFGLGVASGDIGYEDVLVWINEHAINI